MLVFPDDWGEGVAGEFSKGKRGEEGFVIRIWVRVDLEISGGGMREYGVGNSNTRISYFLE